VDGRVFVLQEIYGMDGGMGGGSGGNRAGGKPAPPSFPSSSAAAAAGPTPTTTTSSAASAQHAASLSSASSSMLASGSECVICLTEPRDTTVLPCRHMCLCAACAQQLRFNTNKCPVCRERECSQCR
jgi:hypothetical protein